MAKTKKPAATNDDRISGFPVPFSLDAFRKNIVEVFFHYVRTIGLMTDPETAWRITKTATPVSYSSFYSQEYSAAELGLSYEDIRGTQFAQTLELLYDFAFFGRRDASAEALDDEGIYMWASDISHEALYGQVSSKWSDFGLDIQSHAANCVLVTETANARNILEGGESFSSFAEGSGKNEFAKEGVLTIRQMALLSGMEEMSIRAAAGPKRANPLKTHTVDGGTRVAVDVAKAWLESKGRYVTIEVYRSAGDVDLKKRSFTDYQDLWHALNARCLMIADRDGLETVKTKLGTLNMGLPPGFVGGYLEIDDAAYADEQVMRSLADLLEIPSDLLVLRCKEVVAKEQLASIERQLKQTILTSNSTPSD
jgi:hypothetical protein